MSVNYRQLRSNASLEIQACGDVRTGQLDEVGAAQEEARLEEAVRTAALRGCSGFSIC